MLQRMRALQASAAAAVGRGGGRPRGAGGRGAGGSLPDDDEAGPPLQSDIESTHIRMKVSDRGQCWYFRCFSNTLSNSSWCADNIYGVVCMHYLFWCSDCVTPSPLSFCERRSIPPSAS